MYEQTGPLLHINWEYDRIFLLSYYHFGFHIFRFSLGQVWQLIECCWKELLKTLKVNVFYFIWFSKGKENKIVEKYCRKKNWEKF